MIKNTGNYTYLKSLRNPVFLQFKESLFTLIIINPKPKQKEPPKQRLLLFIG
ncbi:hypothetical protein THERMOT_2000 [Bathymodiolus thermophilus thioautotrophic gill symbiont]|uniref:Uncharacterized protein n=1 Tax=Bathymodiolus thermophilus thioautotrophic gill symbiont TaxID=2360 RepID=A0A8H8XD56_9GAMM|nr:hypothetical protein THERMOS_1614 [Bathymodiolus thermophilus thioautotrophic gill symbiont]CAB5504634.1 hypothetical protein THERMOT_2000 [Bathymodiolus thermophilus thioautotrophic gill symbiont]